MTRTVVVVPTYNERDIIGQLVEAVFAVDGGYDVLVVDDNSPDGTGRFVDEIRIELRYRAMRAGFSIGEIPTIFVDRRRGTSKITRREIYASILTVWKLRLGWYWE